MVGVANELAVVGGAGVVITGLPRSRQPTSSKQTQQANTPTVVSGAPARACFLIATDITRPMLSICWKR